MRERERKGKDGIFTEEVCAVSLIAATNFPSLPLKTPQNPFLQKALTFTHFSLSLSLQVYDSLPQSIAIIWVYSPPFCVLISFHLTFTCFSSSIPEFSGLFAWTGGNMRTNCSVILLSSMHFLLVESLISLSSYWLAVRHFILFRNSGCSCWVNGLKQY